MTNAYIYICLFPVAMAMGMLMMEYNSDISEFS